MSSRKRGEVFLQGVAAPVRCLNRGDRRAEGSRCARADQWAVNCRVLVGDDNADAADMMALLLERVGCEVVRVYDGRSAIASAERMRPDLILLDIGLPHMAGHDICRAVRRQPWGSRATIAAVTGWGQSSDVAASLDAGFDVHLETGLGRTDRRAAAGFQTRRFRRSFDRSAPGTLQ